MHSFSEYLLTVTHKAFIVQGLKIQQWTKYTLSQSSCNAPSRRRGRHTHAQVCVTFIIGAPKQQKNFFFDKGNIISTIPDEGTYFINQQSLSLWWLFQNSRENIFQNDFIPRENRLLNLYVTPGPHFNITFICKLIAFILLVSAFLFSFWIFQLGIS